MGESAIRRLHARHARGAVSVVAIITTAATMAPASPAAAHSDTPCDPWTTPRFSGPNLYYSTDQVAPGLAYAITGIRQAANAWSWFTEISLTEAPSLGTHIWWTVEAGWGASTAGAMDRTRSGCTYTSAHGIISADHFVGGGGQYTVDEKQCIAAHEFGHAFGLGHSNIAGENDTPLPAHTQGPSIMRGNEHSARCHVASPPLGPGNEDVIDVNAKY